MKITNTCKGQYYQHEPKHRCYIMKPCPAKPYLIVAGVSGAGKSTIIRELLQLDPRFSYISPYTNRPLRPTEQEKIYKTDVEIARLYEEGEIVYLNHICGASYATLRKPIDTT